MAVPAGQTDTTGCIGFVLPNCEVRLVNDDYEDVELGKEGELIVRSPVVMEGYFNNEQATKEAFHDSGDGKGSWFCSGDIAIIRNGLFYIVDRKKELLKYKGLQVAPAEIENLLFTHPAVAEAAVVGVPAPDDPGTDLPRAYIVLSNSRAGSQVATSASATWPSTPALNAQGTAQRSLAGDSSKQDTLDQTRYNDKAGTQDNSDAQAAAQSSSTGDSSKQDTLNQTRYSDKASTPGNSEAQLAEELQKYVADRLAQHKQLRGGIKFVPELPKNAIGKFLRRDLRERAKKEIVEERGISKAKL